MGEGTDGVIVAEQVGLLANPVGDDEIAAVEIVVGIGVDLEPAGLGAVGGDLAVGAVVVEAGFATGNSWPSISAPFGSAFAIFLYVANASSGQVLR